MIRDRRAASARDAAGIKGLPDHVSQASVGRERLVPIHGDGLTAIAGHDAAEPNPERSLTLEVLRLGGSRERGRPPAADSPAPLPRSGSR